MSMHRREALTKKYAPVPDPNQESWSALRFKRDKQEIESVLKDLTLIGPAAGEELRQMVYGS